MSSTAPAFSLRGAAMIAAVAAAQPACAQDYEDASGKALTISGDGRVILADGERSWLDGGFGKTRFGPDQPVPATALEAQIVPVEASVVWKPKLSWTIGATLAVIAQQGQEAPVDVSEAYLSWRGGPQGDWKLTARAGLFWPPVSLEHKGADWAVADTITPSAINSWIGEEVKVAGAEATASLHVGGDSRVALTLGLFGLNDTAGTLIAFRGWALHDQKATLFSHQPLPPLDPFMQQAQAPTTQPLIELDGRPGYYARLGWSLADRLQLHAFYYDNRGDPEAVNNQRQWGWRTRFTEIGGTALIGPTTRLTAQALAGRTEMGFQIGGRIWVDTRYRSAFALLTQGVGSAAALSWRVEAFETDGTGSVLQANESERGWATTLAVRHRFGDHVTVLAEALQVMSTRQARLRAGLDPREGQTLIQLALRVRN